MQNLQNPLTIGSLSYNTLILSALCMYSKDKKNSTIFILKCFLSKNTAAMIPETPCMSHTTFLVYNAEDYQKYHKKYFSDFGKLKCNFSVDF